MCMEAKNIRNYLQPGKRAHLVGIGGVSMASLAEVLHGAGVEVTGKEKPFLFPRQPSMPLT